MKNQITDRNMVFVILAALMLFAVQSLSSGQTVSIDPAEVESPAAGEQLAVNVNITGGTDIAGYQITVTFDPTALSFASIENADYLPDGAFSVPPTVTDDSAILAATSLAGSATGDGTLATVTFNVVEVKASTIGLADVGLSDSQANPIAVTVKDGAVVGLVPAPPIAEERGFEVTLTNLTEGAPGQGGQVFSPVLLASHTAAIKLLALGSPASDALRILAEDGNNGPLAPGRPESR